jgi:hypothetical protein
VKRAGERRDGERSIESVVDYERRRRRAREWSASCFRSDFNTGGLAEEHSVPLSRVKTSKRVGSC